LALTTTTTLSEIVPAIIAETREYVRANSLFGPGGLGRRFLQIEDTRHTPGKTVHFPQYNGFTAYDVAEGVDHTTSQALDTSEVTCEATEKIAICTITDRAVSRSVEQVIRDASRELGRALAAKIDADVLALLNGLDYDCGSTGNNCSYAYLLDGINRLVTNKAPKPYVTVLHPQQWYDLGTEASSPLTATTGYGRIAEEFGYNYFVGELYGCTVVVHPDVPLANAGADRSGAILSAKALGMVWEQDITIRAERDESLRATELVCVCTYGVVEINGTMGVACETDA